MEKRGIEMVSVYGVDNCLIKMADPIFFGYAFDKNLDCAAKVVAKASPTEAGLKLCVLYHTYFYLVGVVSLMDGKPGVIEYSEIPTETAHRIDPKTGKLEYNAAHICINMFSVAFLKRFCASHLKSLP
jgi:UDP-N-acetylglucosamine/UDP-N-acetylgalactosamine diphosphorylase